MSAQSRDQSRAVTAGVQKTVLNLEKPRHGRPGRHGDDSVGAAGSLRRRSGGCSSPHVGLSGRFGCELPGMGVGWDRVGAGEADVDRKGHGRAVLGMPCSAMLARSVDRVFGSRFRVSIAACVGC